MNHRADMKLLPKPLFHLVSFSQLTVLCLSLSQGLAWAAKLPKSPLVLGNDDIEFVFAGKCPNGEPYRIFAYSQIIQGQTASMYDYSGPAGQGTIRSNTQPRTLAVRVCRQQAEIIDDQ
jgi:hypothetical protein